MALNKTSCCGLREYDGIMEHDTAAGVMMDAYEEFYGISGGHGWQEGAFIVFTCPVRERRIPKLVRYIEKAKLGTCTVSPIRRNPNSGNNLQVMLFAMNHRNWHAWYNRRVPIKVGDWVRNVHEDAERFGMEAEVYRVDGKRIYVRYENGEEGQGVANDYKVIN